MEKLLNQVLNEISLSKERERQVAASKAAEERWEAEKASQRAAAEAAQKRAAEKAALELLSIRKEVKDLRSQVWDLREKRRSVTKRISNIEYYLRGYESALSSIKRDQILVQKYQDEINKRVKALLEEKVRLLKEEEVLGVLIQDTSKKLRLKESELHKKEVKVRK